MVRALHEMGATRVRISDDGIDVAFLGPGATQDELEVNAERDTARRKQEEQDDLFRSAG